MSNNQKRSKKPENLILKAKVHMRKWCEEVLPLLQLVTPLFVDEAWSPPECKEAILKLRAENKLTELEAAELMAMFTASVAEVIGYISKETQLPINMLAFPYFEASSTAYEQRCARGTASGHINALAKIKEHQQKMLNPLGSAREQTLADNPDV
ncbi:hypothetical protein GPECTOR_2067g1068 [Gonium pectorale]|uniref:Uncharacterized protein n=1 Tax=Gonium pectorale TaxID=33097 RepID=A0A150FUX4_GONPE|nr:hypothetical protein GPECTOR_2067g1068 [Gonium pectorale]|eukprot:KXZ40830.1 hypothetical protein GPECTOR_2067g1068 [Gonium pectorale]